MTIRDDKSRYLLDLRLVEKCNYDTVRSVFVSLFKDYGLPEYIKSDNGPPFAARGTLGLTRLSVWWLSLGMNTPASVYHASATAYKGDPEDVTYPPGFVTRRVKKAGYIKLSGDLIYISEALGRYSVGMLPRDDTSVNLFFLRCLTGLDRFGTTAF